MPLRQIIEDRLYTDQINKYRINWKRLDEVLMSLFIPPCWEVLNCFRSYQGPNFTA